MLDEKVCSLCKLHEGCRSPFMPSHGSKEPLVLIIGEAPGEEEDARNIPFVGKAGKLLRTVLEEIGFDIKKDIRFTYTVRCRPPQNKITKKAIEYCSRFAMEEIKKYKPEMVFIMGNSPLSGILGESGISNWNGSIITKQDVVYMPLYHPAYLLRNPQAMDQWLSALMKAFDSIAMGEDFAKADTIEYHYPKTIPALKEMRDYLDDYEYISYDTEVRGLDAFNVDNMLISVSFASGDRAYSVPIYHCESPWQDEVEREVVKKIVVDILKSHDGNISGHNIKFDQLQTWTALGHWFEAGGDTYIISYLMDCRQGIHGLKRLAGIHLGMFEYDAEIIDYKRQFPKLCDPEKGGSYENIPLSVLEKYGAKDSASVMLLDDILYPTLSKKQKILYTDLMVPMSNFLAYIERNGFGVDENLARRYLKIYSTKRMDMYSDIANDPLVQRLIQARNKAALKIHDEKVQTYKMLRKLGKKKKNSRMPKAPKDFVFNPGSSVHMIELVYVFGKMEPIAFSAKTKQPSTKSSVLKAYEDKLSILPKIRYYKLLTKMVSTYLTPAINGKWVSNLDGKVRSSYNMCRTKTGRLSSKDPNLQNIPTAEKEPGTLLEYLPIKNIFTTSFRNEGVVLTADQSGMELRVFAAASRCEKMLRIHRSGKDFHKMVASDVSKIPYDDVPKPVRYKFKRVNWTLLYGGSAWTLAKLDGFPVEEAEAIVKAYFKEYPEVPNYLDECVSFAEDHNYIESPFGRREHLYYINDRYQEKLQNADRRSAVNMPIQSAASDLVMCGAIILNDQLRARKYDARIVNTVHDSVVLDLPKSELHEVSMLTKYCMENVVQLAPMYFPRMDFSWFNCPLHIDLEAGSHYGAEVRYELDKAAYEEFSNNCEIIKHK